MAEKKEMTDAEKEAKKAEMIKAQEEIAKKNLASVMWGYAAPKFISHEQYGQLAEYSKQSYTELIGKSPDQHVYEQLFLPQLANEGGAITSPYLQNTSAAILQESLFRVKVSEALKYAGVKGDFNDKYVNQLTEEQAGAIVGSAIQYQTDEQVKLILGNRQKGISKNLEELLTKEKKVEPKK
jgi:hypothetical protein